MSPGESQHLRISFRLEAMEGTPRTVAPLESLNLETPCDRAKFLSLLRVPDFGSQETDLRAPLPFGLAVPFTRILDRLLGLYGSGLALGLGLSCARVWLRRCKAGFGLKPGCGLVDERLLVCGVGTALGFIVGVRFEVRSLVWVRIAPRRTGARSPCRSTRSPTRLPFVSRRLGLVGSAGGGPAKSFPSFRPSLPVTRTHTRKVQAACA